MGEVRRLDRQEMERRVVLLRELVEDAECRLQQYGPGSRAMNAALNAAWNAASVAWRLAKLELESYREEWERVK